MLSAIFRPLIANGRRIGVVTVQTFRPEGFTEAVDKAQAALDKAEQDHIGDVWREDRRYRSWHVREVPESNVARNSSCSRVTSASGLPMPCRRSPCSIMAREPRLM